MKDIKTFHCGYCNIDFQQIVTVKDVTGIGKIPARDSIICPRCTNFIKKNTVKN